MELKGIDVSHHQGVIDWDKAKNEIDYTILSIGYGDNYTSQDDVQFKRNADECTRLGIPFGVYIYSYAENTTQAKSEADHVIRVIEGYKLDYPVYYDLEDEPTTVQVNALMN
jgi:lysozyme